MAPLSSTAIFYAVLIAPGFIAVMTAISLAAIENDVSRFILLVWSLVSSLLIDTLFIVGYQVLVDPVTSIGMLGTALFTPAFRLWFVVALLGSSVLVGVIYARLILWDLPGKGRNLLQWGDDVTYNPTQPWPDFMEDAATVIVKTDDDQLYRGNVVEWSRAGRPRQLRLSQPEVRHEATDGFELVGVSDMLLFEDDIQRVELWERDDVQEPEEDQE